MQNLPEKQYDTWSNDESSIITYNKSAYEWSKDGYQRLIISKEHSNESRND